MMLNERTKTWAIVVLVSALYPRAFPEAFLFGQRWLLILLIQLLAAAIGVFFSKYLILRYSLRENVNRARLFLCAAMFGFVALLCGLLANIYFEKLMTYPEGQVSFFILKAMGLASCSAFCFTGGRLARWV
jgi:hypothetical protein